MDGDSVTPLITWAQFAQGAFADLAKGYTDAGAQSDLLVEATRVTESICDRRLAPFTITAESHRAEGIDPDEYTDAANLPMDVRSTIGANYAAALGASTLVRAVWLNEFAPAYPEYWTYSNVSIEIVRSYGGNQPVSAAQVLSGPDVDSGRLWFQLGMFLPIASMVYVTYSGGYATTPGDLSRASKYVVAELIADELDPFGDEFGHDPAFLHSRAETILERYFRS